MTSGMPGPPPRAVDVAGEAARGRLRLRFFLGGFAIGLALDFLITAIQVAQAEYDLGDVPQLLVWNLPPAPYTAAITGLVGLIRTRPWGWRLPRFRTGTLMIAVAYVATLCVAIAWSHRLSYIALGRHARALQSAEVAKSFRGIGKTYEALVRLRQGNAEQLRAGKIPPGLNPGQVEFLRSLEGDPKVTPEFREYRRGLIRAGEEQAAVNQGRAVAFTRRTAEYHAGLAAKYDRARWKPWLPVEPDPPPPD